MFAGGTPVGPLELYTECCGLTECCRLLAGTVHRVLRAARWYCTLSVAGRSLGLHRVLRAARNTRCSPSEQPATLGVVPARNTRCTVPASSLQHSVYSPSESPQQYNPSEQPAPLGVQCPQHSVFPANSPQHSV